MSITYKKLWKLLIDKDLNKTQFREIVGIGTQTLAKLSKNENVSMDVINKICFALNVQPSDIMEYVRETDQG